MRTNLEAAYAEMGRDAEREEEALVWAETTFKDIADMVEMQKKELERWRQQNQESFESYNQMIEKDGLFSDDMGLL